MINKGFMLNGNLECELSIGKGEKGDDGLTTSISVNGETYTHVDGNIKLPDYPSIKGLATENYVKSEIAKAQLGDEDNEIDLSSYATKDDLSTKADKTELPTKISELINDTNFISGIPSEYITELELDSKGYVTEQYVKNEISKAQLEGEDVDLSAYALKTELPTKTSELTNDSGYLTSIPSEYVTETELNAKGYSTFNGDYNNLTNKPTIPSISGLASESYVNEYVENAIKDIPKEEVDLSNYAKKTELPTKLSQLANDKGYITSIPSEYVTESELNNKGYLTEHQDISNKADKTELHNHSNKSVLDGITSSEISAWNNKSNFDGNYNSLTNKPTIPSKVSELENDNIYVTETELNNKGYLTNANFSLGVHGDGGIYLFVNGEPVGMGIFLSNVEIGTSDGYITDDNTIMLSDNIPSGTYSMKYEHEDGSYSLISDFTI